MNTLLSHISEYIWQQSWQIGLLIGIVALVNLALRKRSAHLRYMLWLMVLAKCLLPPLLSVSLAWLPTKNALRPVAYANEGVLQIHDDHAPVVAPPESSMLATPTPTQIHRFRAIVRQHWLVLAWAIAALMFYMIVLVRTMRIIHYLRSHRKPVSGPVLKDLQDISRRYGLRDHPRAWFIDPTQQPFVWGWFKGEIYLPGDFDEITSVQHRQAILAHELSHVYRKDPGTNLLQLIAQGLFWFHPVLWWANIQMRREREKSCDEMAIARMGTKAKDYCQALVNTLTIRHQTTLPLGSAAVADPVKNIEERIKTIMQPDKHFALRSNLWVGAMLLVTTVLVVSTSFALTEKPTQDAKRMESMQQLKRLGLMCHLLRT